MKETGAAGLLAAYRDLTPYIQPCQAFVALAREGELDLLARLGLVLITADCFAQGASRDLLREIRLSGFLPLDISIVEHLREDEVAAMFLPASLPLEYRFWLLKERFALGPSAALLVTHPTAKNVGAALAAAKGDRHPMRAVKHGWRTRLPAINGLLNLVHTADSPAHLIRNAQPFYSTERLLAAARNVNAPPQSTWNQIEAILAAHELISSGCRSFSSVYLDLLERLVGHASREMINKGFVTAQDQIASSMASLDAEAILRAIRAASACCTFCDPSIENLLRTLTDLNDASSVDWDEWLLQLGRTGIVLDRWESLILRTTLYFADQDLPRELLHEIRARS
jgi:hypothetical protein